MTPKLDRGLVVIVAVAALYYLLTLPNVLRRLDPLTGDEPFYVMTAISLLRDRDLDESNNYAQRDYDEFYPPTPLPTNWQGWPAFPRDLPPHPATSTRPGLHTKHGLGLSVLIAAPYALAGRLGADLVIIAFGAILAGQMFQLARESGASVILAAALALGLAVTMPIGPYATLIFPEIPAAALLLFAIRHVSLPVNGVLLPALTGVAIGALPWLHQRFAPTALVLVLIMAARWLSRASLRRCVVALLPAVGMGVALMGYNLWLYGQLTQDSRDHAGFNGIAGTVNGAFGLLLDAQWGLWIAAPLMLPALAALPWWLESNPRLARTALLAVAPYLVVVAAYKVWWGEWGPPARYLVPVVPLAAGPLAAWLRRASLAGRGAAAGLWLLGLALTAVGLANPQRYYHQPDGRNNLVTRLGELIHINMSPHLISFQPFALATRNDRFAAALLALALLFAAWTLIWLVPSLRDTGPGQAPSASAAGAD